MFDLKMKVLARISDLLDYFDVDYSDVGPILVGPCPIHDGDNESAWNINVDENSRYYGLWFCNTKHCHKIKGHDIISFTNLLLDKSLNKKHSFREVMNFLEKFTKGVQAKSFSYSKDAYLDLLEKTRTVKKTKFTKHHVRSRLKIPSQYYVNRGYNPKVLDEFDIGLCVDPQSQFYNRVVFPVYDEDDQYLVGCVGRTIGKIDPKWINKKGFNKANHLYNYGKAIKYIEKTGTVILVEGQGDVLRLWESGIKNCVGIFGSHLSDSQEFLLQRTGATNIVILTDNDDAGNVCRSEIRDRLRNFFNIIDLVPDKKDVGEMTLEEINEKIKPKLEGLI